MLTPNHCQTFDDYFQQVFISYLKQQFLHVSRIDVVRDRYIVGSINGSTIDKRGSGIRRKFDSTTKLRRKWSEFLKDSNNKDELFKFLANKIILHNLIDKVLVTTYNKSIISNNINITMPECDHEEADTRMAVHLIGAVN